MCRVLKVTRADFYDWLHKPLSDRAIEDRRLRDLIRDAYVASGGVYGSPRVVTDLREAGQTCGKNRVARIVQTNKIKVVPLTNHHDWSVGVYPFCHPTN
jgi:putative transposase